MGQHLQNTSPAPSPNPLTETPEDHNSVGLEDVYRRAAVHLVPFLLLCYIMAMVDRLNVGYAKLQFMADLHFDESVFGVSAGILYVGYILFEVPSNLLLERAGLRITLLRIMTLWGLFTMAFAFAATRWNFYGLRISWSAQPRRASFPACCITSPFGFRTLGEPGSPRSLRSGCRSRGLSQRLSPVGS